MLCDTSIRKRLNSESLVIRPLPEDKAIQPASIDLRLGPDFKDVWGEGVWPLEDGSLWVDQGHFRLGTTLERIHLPDDLVARVEGKSSIARQGLIVHTTAGFIDPGFNGQITLEFFNASPKPFHLRPDMYICQLAFDELDFPAERPYGSDGLGSHYQNQRGTTESRL